MSPEQFHDALQYLDDDLITQTDELRQGRRVPHRRPRVIHWLVPAACLALVLGVGPRLLPTMETEDAAQLESEIAYGANMSREEYLTANSGSSTRQDEFSTAAWEKISLEEISLSIPKGWEHELEKAGDGSYFIAVRPAGALGAMKIGYSPNFGVCGTGLTIKQTTIAGMNANAGYYDDGMYWSFITFQAGDKQYVVRKDSTNAWWDAHGETAAAILETIEISD